MRFPFGRRAQIATLGAVVLAAAVAAVTMAAFPESDVTSYTGCLSASSGQIKDVSTGADPLRSCGPNDSPIHLSGGDITKVTAGPGLTGGGDNGAVTVGLDTGFQLPQSCADGQVAVKSGPGWACASPDPSVFTTGGEATIDPDDSKIVASLSLPAGTYLVLVTGTVNNNDTGNVEAECVVENNGFPTFAAFEVQTELTDVGHSVIPVAANGTTSSATPFKVNVSCLTLGSNELRDRVRYSVGVTAMRVGSVTSQ
jgi:hypothetical protein